MMVTTLHSWASARLFDRYIESVTQLNPIQLTVHRVFSFLICFSSTIQLNLTGHCNGLTKKEIKDLWIQADIDGNGIVDYKEFQVIRLLFKTCS